MFEFLILTQIEETLEKADLQLHTELWYTESGTTTGAAAADGEVNGGGAADCDDASTVKGENGESPPQQQHQHNPS